MVQAQAVFSGFSVNDMAAAKAFYTDKLGLTLQDETMGLQFGLPGGGQVFVYQKDDHQPATFTILNFVVANIDEAVEQMTSDGIVFEKYDTVGDGGPKTDDKGIARGRSVNMGPDIAWFKDPAGNILSVLQN